MEKYEKGGSAGSKGIHFQISLLMMFLLKALDSTLKNWRLSTEHKQAGKFDDVVLEMPDGTIMLQAKYREKQGKRVTFAELMSTNSKQDNFSLPKYFHSYQEIKTKFSIKNIIICTNADVDEKVLQYLNIKDIDFGNILHYMGSRCSIYKLKDSILPYLKDAINKYHEINLSGKDLIVNDEDIEDFLRQLDIHFNYPCEKDLEKVLKQFLPPIKHYNLCRHISLTEFYEKIKKWFELPTGQCEYLTEINANAIFCEIKSENYCEMLYKFKVFFQTDDDFIIDGLKKIYHIVTDGRYLLHIIKIYHILQKKQQRTLYVDPEDSIDVQQQILEAFELPCYKFLIMTWANIIEETLTANMSKKLRQILEKYNYKSIIFIGTENNKLLEQIRLNNEYSLVEKNITFKDLAKDTQYMLLNKPNIVFQGNYVNLNELLSSDTDEDHQTALSSDVLEKLIQGEEIQVGVDVPFLDQNIAQCYIHRKFKRKTFLSEELISENDMFNLDQKVVLIVDSAGTGKSTVLASLAITIKKNNPHLWVIRVELNNYTEILNELLEGNEKSLDIIQLLNSKKATTLETHLETFIFSKNNKVVLMLDGVDEISPDYTNLVLEMLTQCLRAPNLAKIFVTSRPHITKQLEEQLKVSPFNLQPLEKQDQIHFLTSYWKHNLNLQDKDKTKCKQYAEALMSKLSSWLPKKIFSSESDGDILAMPLIVRMVAEIFIANSPSKEPQEWQGCNEFLKSEEVEVEPKLPNKMNIAKLYEMFIRKKEEVFLEKENPSGHTAAKGALKDKFDECLTCHRSLAIKRLLNKKECETFSCSLQCNKKLSPYMLKIGIVHQLQGKYDFIHRTFAEYFLADCLVMELQYLNENIKFQQFFINEVLSLDRFNVTRAFMDSFLAMTLDFISSNTFQVYQYLPDESMKYNCALIHRLAKEGWVGILQLILKCIDFKVINDKDIYIDYVIENGFEKPTANNVLSVTKFMVELGGVNIKDEIHEKTPLHYASRNGHLEMVKLLIEMGANVNSTDQAGCTALWDTHNLDIIRYLSEKGININKKNNSGRTALHYAAITPQDLTAQSSKSATIKCLVECGADVNARDNDECTPLHVASSSGSLETIKSLIECGADVNAKEKYGRTALHAATLSGMLKNIEFLVGFADVNNKDSNGSTALHLVASRSRLKSIKLLVACGADVNIRNNDGYTPLHLAAVSNQLENIKFLVEYGVDVNVKGNDGRTPLQLARARLCHRAVINFLATNVKV